jgi:dephospho-CoA kinase
MIIGLTGSFGAGKGAVVEYLVEKKGFVHFSARTFIVEVVEKRGLPVNRDSMILIGNELRKEFGSAYIIESLYKRALKKGGDIVIESLRAIGEVESLQAHGGCVLGVDADPKIRYERAFARGSETDKVTFEKWCEQEEEENNQSDPTKQNIFGALQLSDVVVQNDGSFEELYTQVDKALEAFSKQK